MVTKICTKCKRELPSDKFHFYVDNRSSDNFCYSCKECKGHKFTHPKISPDHGNKICSQCNEEFPLTPEYYYKRVGKRDGYDEQCKNCISRKGKLYRIENKERYYKRQRNWRIKDEGRSDKIYKQKHEAHIKRVMKVYRSNNYEILREYAHLRRSREMELPSTFTNQQWEDVKKYFGNECCYCGKELPLEREHFISVRNGGPYTKENIIPACRSCNSSKNSSNPFDWYPRQPFYTKDRELKILKCLEYN